jgi:hypothetical protein
MKKLIFVFIVFFVGFLGTSNTVAAQILNSGDDWSDGAAVDAALAKNAKAYGKTSEVFSEGGINTSKRKGKYLKGVAAGEEGSANLHNLSANTTADVVAGVSFALVVPTEKEKNDANLTPKQSLLLEEKYGRGVADEMSGFIAALYAPPASSKAYVADLLDSANIIPQARAQGLGFSSLNPILDTWKVMRNVAYLFFVIIFLVIGFMIMFRHKIGGQAAVTAQQAIPSIIIALLMVTFSYAIAGLFIDLMYVFMYLLLALFPNVGGTELISGSFLKVGLDAVVSSWPQVGDTISAIVDNLIGNEAANTIVSAIGGLTVRLIVAVAIVIAVFKLFFELLKTYVNLIAGIALAPLILMFGAIPGKDVFGSWLKNIYGNLIAFPAVLFILIMNKMLTQGGIESGGFMPPFLIGQGQAGIVPAVIGIGILLIMPEIVVQVKKAAGVTNPFEELVNAAVSQFQAGMPLPTKVLGALGGAGIGAGVGALTGIRDTQESIGKQRRIAILGNAARYAGSYASHGGKAGGWVSSSLGGKSTGLPSSMEGGIDKLSGLFTEEAMLKRRTTPGKSLHEEIKDPGAMTREEYTRQLGLAKAERERRIDLEEALGARDMEAARKHSIVKD